MTTYPLLCHCSTVMSELSLLVAGSFSKLHEKAKCMEDNDTSNVETEPEAEVSAAGRPKRHARWKVHSHFSPWQFFGTLTDCF